MLHPTTIPYSEQCQPWSGPSYQCTPPYSVRLSGLHLTPCATPYNQLFIAANSVNHGVGALINALHPTPCYSVGSTLPIWLRPTAVPYSDHPLLIGHHPTLYYGVGIHPTTLYCTLQLLFTANKVSHGMDSLCSGLHPTPCAGPTAIP